MFSSVQFRTRGAYTWLLVAMGLLTLFGNLGIGRRSAAKSFVGATSPVWAPDGQHIAFLKPVPGSTDGSTSDLYLINANGSGAVKLTSGPIYSPLWSPDGKQILVEKTYFTADTFGAQANQQYASTGLDAVNVASGAAVSLTKDGYHATWSADGKQVYFVREDGKLYVIKADGSGLQAALPENLPAIFDYALSPDGKHVAIVHQRDSQNEYDLVFYVVNADGSELHQIDTGTMGVAAWSPDSRQLVTISNCGGHSGLCLFNADGSGMHSLVEDSASLTLSSSLAWSPNGKWIAYVHMGQIALIGPDGANRATLTPTMSSSQNDAVFSPSWSSDSQRIVFQAQYVLTRISGDPLMISELYIVNTNGMNLTLLQGLDTLP